MLDDLDPVDPDLSETGRLVLSYLRELPGDGWLAGQEEHNHSTSDEQAYVESVTGHRPALRGFETAAYSIDPMPAAERAFHEAGQLVTLGYHAGAPPLDDSAFEHSQADGDVAACLEAGTEAHRVLHEKLDRMADRLATLDAADVPVLWRPYHEMNGDWFWWSHDGPMAFRRLWQHTVEYLQSEHDLHNLIWVWAASFEPDPMWYPGDEYVDVVGTDVYREQRPDVDLPATFRTLATIAPDAPAALAETDHVPHPEDVREAGSEWVWFLPWHTDHVRANDEAHLRAVYDHEYTLTAADLPEFT